MTRSAIYSVSAASWDSPVLPAFNTGRFLSPDFNESGDDPEPVPYARLENPQSLNLYSYVKNNPLSRRDENGHACDQGTVVNGVFIQMRKQRADGRGSGYRGR
jgi:hypothetical protein